MKQGMLGNNFLGSLSHSAGGHMDYADVGAPTDLKRKHWLVVPLL